MMTTYNGHSFIIRLIAAESLTRTRFIWDVLNLSLLYLGRIFSADMRRVILSQRAMYIKEDAGTRQMIDAVEAQPKAVTHFTHL